VVGCSGGALGQRCRLRDRLTTPDREGAGCTRALDLLSVAAFLDRTGCCRRWNAAGDALLQDGGLVRLQGGRLVSTCPGSGPAVLGSCGPTALRRRDGKVDGHATVHALPGHGPLGAARAVVFIDLVKLSRPVALQDALVAAYGLTVREAELVARLAEGMDLPTAAKSMGLGGAAASDPTESGVPKSWRRALRGAGGGRGGTTTCTGSAFRDLMP
jgi:hypothetical protein